MATRTYVFTALEQAQFKQLVALGFSKEEDFTGNDEPRVFFRHKALGIDCTFFPEPYADTTGGQSCWKVDVHGKTNGGFNCITTSGWLTASKFNTLIDPEPWSEMTATLKRLRGMDQWKAVIEPLLQGKPQTTGEAQSLFLEPCDHSGSGEP